MTKDTPILSDSYIPGQIFRIKKLFFYIPQFPPNKKCLITWSRFLFILKISEERFASHLEPFHLKISQPLGQFQIGLEQPLSNPLKNFPLKLVFQKKHNYTTLQGTSALNLPSQLDQFLLFIPAVRKLIITVF